MRIPNLTVHLVQALDLNVGGVVQDRAAIMTKIAGYMICIRGTNAALRQLDPEVDVGQIILRSALFGDFLTEPHLGFLVERTVQKKGNTRFINLAGGQLDISVFHDFDNSGDYSHANIYTVLPGDCMEWVLPAVDAAVATGVWEVHRIEADTGVTSYLPRWRTRGLPVEEIAFTFDGRTAALMMMPASGVGAANPDRVSIFDPFSKREVFLPWDAFLAWTNAQFRYDADQAEYVCWQRHSDILASVKNVFKSTQVRVEFTGGAGLIQSSYAIMEEPPEEMRRVTEMLSEQETAAAERSALQSGVTRAGLRETEKSALTRRSASSTPIGMDSSPIGPVARKRSRVSIF